MDMSALELGKRIREGKTDAVAAAKAALDRIREKEESLGAFIHVLPEDTILRAAEDAQRRIERKEALSPLAGVPFAVKDNLCVKDCPTTCGSKMLKDYVPAYTAHAVTRLLNAGAVLIGKTNMDEFAMGSTTETSFFGATKNPYDPARSPGGSSGGSAAAVAAGEVSFALGTDTGGSVRQPASHCGIVGFKPGYGTVSRSGLIAYASSLDVVGVLAKDLADAKAVMELLTDKDPADMTSVEAAFEENEEGKPLRIGIPKSLRDDPLDPEVRALLMKTAEEWREKGAEVSEFDLALTEAFVPVYYTIATAEASSNLERYDGVKYGHRAQNAGSITDLMERSREEGFGEEVKRRILMGTFVLSREYYDAYYRRALRLRAAIRRAYEEALSSYDLLLTPVTPSPAPLLGTFEKSPVRMYADDLYTVGPSLAGLPAVSIPAGKTRSGLPVGMQYVGSRTGVLRSGCQ